MGSGLPKAPDDYPRTGNYQPVWPRIHIGAHRIESSSPVLAQNALVSLSRTVPRLCILAQRRLRYQLAGNCNVPARRYAYPWINLPKINFRFIRLSTCIPLYFTEGISPSRSSTAKTWAIVEKRLDRWGCDCILWWGRLLFHPLVAFTSKWGGRI